MEEDLLDCLLSAAAEEIEDEIKPKLKQVNEDNEDRIFLGKISSHEDNLKVAINSPSQKQSVKSKEKLQNGNKPSVVHSGDTDSSDDEQNRDYENAKYNEFGRDIKRHLAESSDSKASSDFKGNRFTSWKTDSNRGKMTELSLPDRPKPIIGDVYTDPVFGIRITKPLISSSVLQERMIGREAVLMSRVKMYVNKLSSDKDWVIAGAVVRKTAGKTSAKGNQFSVWTLSDLHGDLKCVTIFLFGNAHRELWKVAQGTVVGILNPSVLEGKGNGKEEATLSVNNAQKVMVLGHSKDLGTCKSTTKSGEKCTAFVNTSKCEFCIYHIRQEYQKCSTGRSELQSTFAGRGLTALRNKVLGKNEVFYAGKSYMAIPAKKSKKLESHDQKRLASLSGMNMKGSLPPQSGAPKSNNTSRKKQNAAQVESVFNQKAKDLELLRKLGGGTELNSKLEKISNAKDSESLYKPSSSVSLEESKNTALSVIAKLKAKKNGETKENSGKVDDVDTNINENITSSKYKDILSNNSAINKSDTYKVQKTETSTTTNNKSEISQFGIAPTGFSLLSGLGDNKTIDLHAPISKRQKDQAKMNALQWVKKNGPIKKTDPMNIRGGGQKRPLDDLEKVPTDAKKQKIQENEFFSDRFKKMMEATSSHTDLLEQRDNDEQEKYFDKLEVKERMEEKMMSTYKIECKAVRCLKCKYTSFSASDLCKTEKHPLKVFDAFKRFFKCGDCGNRTCCLEIIPLYSCKNCGSGKWERTTMMKEKKVTGTHNLSIRGGEQQFLNSNVSNANLNLLVPEDD